MRKIVYFVAVLLVLSSLALVGLGEETSNYKETSRVIFSKPTIIEKNEYLEIDVVEANSLLFSGGKPLLPEYRETITLPFGVKIDNVNYEIHGINTEVLSKKIAPAPHLVPLTIAIDIQEKSKMDEEIYGSNDFFPQNWIDYNIGVGLDDNMEHKTFLTINRYPVRYSSNTNTIQFAEKIDVTFSYTEPVSNPFPTITEYKLVIIAPTEFTNELQKLADHKISKGVSTKIVTTDEIYSQYSGVDKPEKIKYFIKNALETWGTKYVLLVGGLKSLLWANPRENINYGVKGWHVPVRYSNLQEGEPGYCCDLYYSDIYKEGGEFDNWDSNGDGIIAYWKGFKKDKLDMYPDVAIGRLACRNINEVRSVIDKIKNYEDGTDPSWFNDMLVVSGDGFLDMEDLDIKWDTNGLPNGEYTIFAQSENPDGKNGPIEQIKIEIDKTKETKLTFNHDDNLRVSTYPANPIAEIVSVSEGDILGNTDYSYIPTEGEAYCNKNTHWANIEYKSGILSIRGKTYDPQPYGNVTDIYVWIEDSTGTEIFRDQRLGYEMYFEGEWTTGNKLLNGRAGAPYYMPSEFDFEYLWTSNGKWTEQQDVIEALSKGSGFAFFSGHGSPAVWVNHKPGIPGNRRPADVEGLKVWNFPKIPFFPMNKLTNRYKNPIVVVGGCHNSMFNVSLIPTFLDIRNRLNTHTYGTPTAECWSWWITALSKRGAIACIGNTGYGYGVLGELCTTGGVDNWITTEFFVQYGAYGHDILGEAHALVIKSYIDNIGKSQVGDAKTIQQWVLLGDPSLKIGGYNTQQKLAIEVINSADDTEGIPNEPVKLEAISSEEVDSYLWDLDDDGEFDDATGKIVEYTWDNPGVFWVRAKAINSQEEIIKESIVEIEKNLGPNTPSQASGARNIITGKNYLYSTSTTDPYNNQALFYIFDWGDETFSYSGPHFNGAKATAIHKWSEPGDYKIKVIAFDSFGGFSEESEPLTISVSNNRQSRNLPILDLFKNLLNNYAKLVSLLQRFLLQ